MIQSESQDWGKNKQENKAHLTMTLVFIIMTCTSTAHANLKHRKLEKPEENQPCVLTKIWIFWLISWNLHHWP